MNPNAVSVKDIAEVFNLSERMIQNWVAEAAFPEADLVKAGTGAGRTQKTYKLREVVEWHINRQVDKFKARLDATPENQAQANLRKTTAEAELKELEVARRKDELVEVSEVENAWLQGLGRFRDTLLRSGQSFSQDVISLPEITFNSVRELYDINAHSALEEMANTEAVDQKVEEIEIKISND